MEVSMTNKIIVALLLTVTIVFTSYVQLIIKWQMNNLNSIPGNWKESLIFFSMIITNKWIVSAFFSSLVAFIFWVMLLSKCELSYAYPLYISITFITLIAFSFILFGETVSVNKIISIVLILLGIIIGSL